MPSTLPTKLDEFLQTFDALTDREDRSMLLLSYADKYRPVPPDIARPPYPATNKVPYCESEAYVWTVLNDDGTMDLHFAVENPSGVSAKALAAILERTLSGLPPTEIAKVNDEVVTRIFGSNVSMGKGMGLMAMVQRVAAAANEAAKRGSGTGD